MSENPTVLRTGLLDMQVCVPSGWTDEQVIEYANRVVPCGTEHGWGIRKQGDKLLGSDPERNPCSQEKDHVHITLDA